MGDIKLQQDNVGFFTKENVALRRWKFNIKTNAEIISANINNYP